MTTMHAILVVDDEPASVRTITRALAGEYDVTTAGAAAQALAMLAEKRVALIIADQRMPGMSGIELLARCQLTYPDTVRVLLTGYADIETLVEAINAGHVYHYVPKPWEPHELRLVVRRGVQCYEAELERRRLLRQLEQACARVGREAEQKGRLLTVAAHELGTPLHLITNALALVAEGDLPAETRQWIETAQRGALWLGRGLAQMLRGARWHAAGSHLRYAEIDVGTLLSNVQASFASVAAHRSLTLLLDVSPGLPRLRGDRLCLQTALGNLVSNAIRFTPDGGVIVVSVVPRAAAGVDIAVADTGIGIDAAALDEVFEAFSRVGGDLSLHTSGGLAFGARGLGLGLAITKAIVERHGGTIGVASQLGAGTRFTITLPLQPGGAQQSARVGPDPPGTQANAQVLVGRRDELR